MNNTEIPQKNRTACRIEMCYSGCGSACLWQMYQREKAQYDAALAAQDYEY